MERPVKVKVDHLTKRFGDLLVLNDVSFEVKKGEFLCIVGPTGCGKTTFLNSLTGLYILSPDYTRKLFQDFVRNFTVFHCCSSNFSQSALERAHHFHSVANYSKVAIFEYRSLLVFIYCDNNFAVANAHHMLDLTGDSRGDI